MGNPVPTVSLYLDGHLIRSDNKRHLVTTVFNASRIVKKVGCSATNGKVGNNTLKVKAISKKIPRHYEQTIAYIDASNSP